jgi:hypothetical protein
MKARQIHEELLEIAKQCNIEIRRDKGTFRSGVCLIDEKEVVVLNRAAPIESQSSALARSIASRQNEMFLKPAVREFIDREKNAENAKQDFTLEVPKEEPPAEEAKLRKKKQKADSPPPTEVAEAAAIPANVSQNEIEPKNDE